MTPRIMITSPWSAETYGDSVKAGFYYLEKHYLEAVVRAGGFPLIIAPEYPQGDLEQLINSILTAAHGLVFSGGGSLDLLVGKKRTLPTALEEQQPVRYHFEKKLLEAARERKMPVLGICRGHQMIAEVFGGKLLDSFIDGHQQDVEAVQPWHEVTITAKNCITYQVLGVEKWQVNSFHQQVIAVPPAGFKVTIKSREGYIEGIEAADHPFFLGLQFHPESLSFEDEKARHIFAYFINQARLYREGNKGNR